MVFTTFAVPALPSKSIHALLKQARDPRIDLKEYLDIVALATLADLVPLAGENRIFVHRGLQQLAKTRWPGLAALMTVANVRPPIRGSDVGFRFGTPHQCRWTTRHSPRVASVALVR